MKDKVVNTYENLVYRNRVRGVSVYSVVVFVFIFFLCMLPVVKVDVSSQGRGVVRSKREPVVISSIVSARVGMVNISNNKRVNKGDTLLVLRSEAIERDRESYRKNIEDNKKIQQDLERISRREFGKLQSALILEEYSQYIHERGEVANRVSQAKSQCDVNKRLYDKGIISEVKYKEAFDMLKSIEEQLKGVERKYFAMWENRRLEVVEKLVQMEGNYDKMKIERDNYVITSPFGGSIESFSGVEEGNYLTGGSRIAVLSSDEDLIGEVQVMPKDIGYVKKGQRMRLLFDTYNYTQWGTLEGEVLDIDNNLTQEGNMLFFKVRCAMNGNSLSLKNGYKGDVQKGMTFTARFILDSRSLYQLLFDKVDDWLNPVRG